MQEKIKSIKQTFFAFRNGILADQLRHAGCPAKMIFGLNVPQLAEIARTIGTDHELALTLWADVNVRESRLLATYLFDKTKTDLTMAIRLIESIQTPEEADMLCFRLLKHLPFADSLVREYESSQATMSKYLAHSLRRHLE